VTLAAGTQLPTSLAVDPTSGAFVCAYEDYGRTRSSQGNDIYVARSDDGGGTWTEHRINGLEVRHRRDPQVAFSPSGAVVSSWVVPKVRTAGDIYFGKSRDGGTTWDRQPLALSPGNDLGPALARHPTLGVGLAWRAQPDGYQIRFSWLDP
jgi:hypothetical protein